jgi:type VI secretion system protein ImpM
MTGCGFYGKLPSEGDFISRRLPWEFTSAWDAWLQQGMQASRQALGTRWLECYLSAPIWRFQVAPGVCGPQGWRGLFFASVDRVGRYFPLTLACVVPASSSPHLAMLSNDAEAWTAAEDAALESLDPKLAVDDVDRLIASVALPASMFQATGPACARVCLYTNGSADVAAKGLSLDTLPPPGAFVDLIAPSAGTAATASLIDP